MRVAIANLVSTFPDDDLVFPLGPARLAAALADRYDVLLLDQNPERLSATTLAERVAKFSPDLVGVSLRNVDNTVDERSHVPAQGEAVDAIRRAVGDRVPVVGGGSGFHLFEHALLDALPGLDAAVLGYGEAPLLRILEKGLSDPDIPGLLRRDRDKNPASPRIRSEFPPPTALSPLSMIDREPYLGRNRHFPPFGIETKRGCANRCAYCPYPRLQGGGAMLRPLDRILADAQDTRRHGVTDVFLVDPVCNQPSRHLDLIAEELSRAIPDMTWHGWFREDAVDRDRLERWVDQGLRSVSFSADGMTDAELDRLGKKLTVDQILHAAQAAARIEIPVIYHFFTEIPGIDPAVDLDEKKALLAEIYRQHERHGNLAKVIIHEIRLYPRTPARQMAVSAGFLKGTEDLLSPVFFRTDKGRAARKALLAENARLERIHTRE